MERFATAGFKTCIKLAKHGKVCAKKNKIKKAELILFSLAAVGFFSAAHARRLKLFFLWLSQRNNSVNHSNIPSTVIFSIHH